MHTHKYTVYINDLVIFFSLSIFFIDLLEAGPSTKV